MSNLKSANTTATPIRSWTDGYAALRRHAGEVRGWIELDTDAWDRRWPRTTGLDAVVIAAFVDEAFQKTDQVTYAGTALRWASCKDELERDALGALGDTYSGNRAFWPCLAMMCAHLAYLQAPLPSQAAWNTLLLHIGASPAAALERDAPPVWFAGVTSLDKLYSAQRQYLANLHGADRRDPEPSMTGGTMAIPRSTNGEVLELAAFWSAVLQIDKARRTNGYSTVLARWRAVADDIAAGTRGASSNAVYPRNHAFWRAAASVAIHVAASLAHGLSDRELRAVIGSQLRESPLRNGPPTKDVPPVWFVSVPSLDKLYLAQRQYLANLRGSDRLEPEADMTGTVMPVPRSTNEEVLKLAKFWTNALNVQQAKNANGYATALSRWNAVLADIEKYARGADPGAVYTRNHAFWRAASSVSRHVAAALNYGMTDAELWRAGVGESTADILERAKEIATVVATTVRDLAADAARGAGKVVNAGARGLAGGFATPLLIGGGALAAFLLLRKREPAHGEPR